MFMVWVSSTTLMVIFLMDNGLITRRTASEITQIPREPSMKGIGSKINSMVKVLRSGRRVPCMKESMLCQKNKVMVSILGQMDPYLKESGLITKFMAMEYTSGKMAGNITANGLKTICKVTAFTFTQMEFDTMANILMTRKKDTESTIGLMVESMKGGGMEGSNMGLVLTVIVKCKQ